MLRNKCYVCHRPIYVDDKDPSFVYTEHKGQNRGCWYKAQVHTSVVYDRDTASFERRQLCWKCNKEAMNLLKEVST